MLILISIISDSIPGSFYRPERPRYKSRAGDLWEYVLVLEVVHGEMATRGGIFDDAISAREACILDQLSKLMCRELLLP